MIAVDSDLLVYAHRRDSPWHHEASRCLRELAEGRAAWSIPWPCVHEFLSIVTHPQIYQPPSTLQQALDQVECWFESPTVAMLAETEGYWQELRRLLDRARVAGPKIHDARIAALCRLHGVRALWTADRDFNRFTELVTQNPLVG